MIRYILDQLRVQSAKECRNTAEIQEETITLNCIIIWELSGFNISKLFVYIREYTDISKERLHNREEKYIKRYDSIKNGLNMHSMGGYYCIHDKLKRYCIECDGSSMCIHEKVKRRCKDCKGPDICIHEKVKHKCVECKGGSTCMHEKIKTQCKICSPATCEHCRKTYAGKQYLKKHQLKCSVNQNISPQ